MNDPAKIAELKDFVKKTNKCPCCNEPVNKTDNWFEVGNLFGYWCKCGATA